MSYIKIAQPGEVIETDVAILSGGQKLAGVLFRPVRPPRAVIVLNAATGVRQRYYRPFAEWAARTQGLACLTYDYRDFGASARGHVKASKATMADWGVHDAQAARDMIRARMPDVPLWVMGHSLGCLLLAHQRDLDQVDRVIAVASGPVHVSEHPWPYQAVARAFWYGPGPVATWVMGYLPGRRLGVGPDMPSGVYWQWRRFCTRRDFTGGDIGRSLSAPDLTGLRAPMKFVAVADDHLVPPKAVWRLMGQHREAPKSQLVLHPSAYGLGKIGHIGVLGPESEACWADIVA